MGTQNPAVDAARSSAARLKAPKGEATQAGWVKVMTVRLAALGARGGARSAKENCEAYAKMARTCFGGLAAPRQAERAQAC